MERLSTRGRQILTLIALLVLPARALAQDLETVIEWQRITQATVASTPTPTIFFTRPYAMASIAMFDAINSIDRQYRGYMVEVSAGANASRTAAVAQAAHDVLVAAYPGQRATLDAALATSLAGIPPEAAAEGSRVGAAAARACIDGRATDRWNAQPTPYSLPNLPGYYQVTPPQNATVTFTHYPDVTPFVMGHRSQFLTAPPPPLTTEAYARDFNEVKSVGSVNSTTRTAEQTSIAQRWAGVNTTTQNQVIWANLLRDLARRTNMSAVDLARAYALLNMAVHDALQTSFNGKFLYGLWRQVTAIRNADGDGNPATTGDPAWLPLLATPPYPTYPGNMTCIAAAAARTMERVFGRDDVTFSVTWTGTAGNADITRSFNGFRQLANEQMESRIYGGIHFRFDQDASFGVCTLLADYAFTNYLRRR